MGLTMIQAYPLFTPADRPDNEIQIPYDHAFLSAGVNAEGQVCLWFMIDPSKDALMSLKILIFASKMSIPHVGDYLGTVRDGPFVWHIFTDKNAGVKRSEAFHYLTKDNG